MALSTMETMAEPEDLDFGQEAAEAKGLQVEVSEAELFGYGHYANSKPVAREILEEYATKYPEGKKTVILGQGYHAELLVGHDLVVIRRIREGNTPKPPTQAELIRAQKPDAPKPVYTHNPYDAQFVVELYNPGDEVQRPTGHVASMTYYNKRAGTVEIFVPVESTPEIVEPDLTSTD